MGGRSRKIIEFQASLHYTVSSRTVWGTQRAAFSKQNGTSKRKLEHNTVLKQKQINILKQNLSRSAHRDTGYLLFKVTIIVGGSRDISGTTFQPATLLSDWLIERILSKPQPKATQPKATQTCCALFSITLQVLDDLATMETPCGLEQLLFPGAPVPEPSLIFGSGLSLVTVTDDWAFIELHRAESHV